MRVMLLLIGLTVSILSVMPCQAITLSMEEQEWLDNTKEISIGVMDNWPPLNFVNPQGGTVGLGSDYLAAIERQLGRELKIVPAPFTDNIKALKSGGIDGLMDMTPTPERRRDFSFSQPYLQIPHVIIGNSSGPFFASEQDLSGKTVAVEKGYYTGKRLAAEYPEIRVVSSDTTSDCLDAVSRSEVDGYIGNRAVALYLIDRELISNLQFMGRASKLPVVLTIGADKDNHHLVSIIDKALMAIPESERQAINQRWRTTVSNQSVDEVDDSYILWIYLMLIVPLLLLAGVSYFAARFLSARPISFLEKLAHQRIIIAAIGGFVVTVALLSWYTIHQVEKSQRKSAGQYLSTVVNLTDESLTYWSRQIKAEVEELSVNPSFTNLVMDLLDQPENIGASGKSSIVDGIRDLLQKKGFSGDQHFYVIAKNKRNIVALLDEESGRKNHIFAHRPELLLQTFAGATVFIPPTLLTDSLVDQKKNQTVQRTSAMYIASPLRQVDGQVLAALVLEVNKYSDFTRILLTGRIGRTGETYLFDSAGWLLSGSRFVDELIQTGRITRAGDEVLSIRLGDPGQGDNDEKNSRTVEHSPVNPMVQSSITGQHGVNISGYQDYRGRRVLGAWVWNDLLNVGVVSEMDEPEALASFYTNRRLIIGMFSFTVFSALVISGFIFWNAERNRYLLKKARDDWERIALERSSQFREAQQRAEGLSRDFSNFLESTSDLVYLKDVDLRYRACSKELAGLIGYDDWHNIVGKTDEQIENEDSLLRFNREPEIEVLEKGSVLTMTENIITRGKQKGTVSTIKKPLLDDSGQVTGILSISRDITEISRISEELRVAVAKAEEATRAKSEFLANMSHEIRTPMNAVIGMTHLALQTDLDSRQRDYVTKAHDAAGSLLDIINEILDFSKIEAGKIELERVDFRLKKVLDQVAAILAPKAEAKELDLVFHINRDVPDYLLGDPLRIRQVLMNLTSNGLKFTESGEVVVSVKIIGQNGEDIRLQFMVKDSGIGMTREQTEKLFHSFSQGDSSTTRKYGGSGLGLSISKGLVEMMGGSIGVNSSIGKGSQFTFELSFGRSVSSEVNVEAEASSPQGLESIDGARLLLVEDNEINQLIATELLETKGGRIRIANNGQEAVHITAHESFDLILMDIQMPVMDGYEASRRIVAEYNKKGIGTPVVAMTANAMVGDRERSLAAGMVDHITKPIDPLEFYKTVTKWLTGEKTTPPLSPSSTAREVGREEAMPSIPMVNVMIGLERANGNKKLYFSLLKKFSDGHRNTLATLQAAMDSNDKETAERTAHSLKGVAATLGIETLEHHAKNLEHALRENNRTGINDLLAEVQASLSQTALSVAASIEQYEVPTQEPVQPGSARELREFLTRLKAYAEKRRPKPAKEVYEEMEGYVWPNSKKDDVASLGRLLSHYKFKEMVVLIDRLLGE